MKTVHIQISASGLKDMDAYSKRLKMNKDGRLTSNKVFRYFSDPFFSIKCRDPYGYYKAVYTSETIKDDLNPRWKPFSVVDSELCSRGDYNSPLKIMVFDWDKVVQMHLISHLKNPSIKARKEFSNLFPDGQPRFDWSVRSDPRKSPVGKQSRSALRAGQSQKAKGKDRPIVNWLHQSCLKMILAIVLKHQNRNTN